jgi:DNA-binding GntR family transcriptional regulator
MNVLHYERVISRNDRAERFIIDHMPIIEAIEQHNTELAEQFVRQHALNLTT